MKTKTLRSTSLIAAAAVLGVLSLCESSLAQAPCTETIKANVVALDQAYYNNRLGAINAGGMIFALRRDVVSTVAPGGALTAGQVMLRSDKRPRPIVLRVNAGQCLEIAFQNLLGTLPEVFNPNAGNQQYPVKTQAPGYQPNQNASINQPPDPSTSFPFDPINSQPATRLAGVHVMGLDLVKATTPGGAVANVSADGSWVGANDVTAVNPQKLASGLVGPGESITYTYYAKSEGSFLLYSTAANTGVQLGFGGQLMQGLFGSVTVQPKTAEWYRSQVTKADLDLASDGSTPDGHPKIKYDKKYPPGHPRAGQPILKMLDDNKEIIYSDLTAIITGPNAGRFNCADCPGQNCQNCPDFRNNPSYPSQTQPFREFAIHYHDDFVSTQAFEPFRKHNDPERDSDMTYTLQGSRDFFAINYGMAGIGPEIWSNRIGVGPMHQCATCRFEEFFLTSWAVGDPAMVVDFPANSVAAGALGTAPPKPGPKATKAFYPDDPSNVYHSYMSDHVKFQILHAGTNITHVHHLHAHQWLHSPNNDNSSYRDSQMISPGGSYTLNHTFNGSGNKNKTVGDSIFHCHFYPHFAQGMWALWRVHDVFERGTELDNQGRPTANWNRVLPDGEIAAGTPIPAIVPLPTLPMAPIGADVKIVPVTVPGVPTPVGFRADVNMASPNIANGPGYPFFIPGVAGQRAPHPPLDFAPDPGDVNNPYMNGGLPRFIAVKEMSPPCTGAQVGPGCMYEKHNRWDFTKFNDKLKAVALDENGTAIEKIAMTYHEKRFHDTFLPDGTPATGNNGFVLNGRPRVAGAPYADPAVDLNGNPVCPTNQAPCLMRYKAANIQLDLVFNKKGQHYPQGRMISLWGDVQNTITNARAPEPFFFRANSNQVIEYWLANLVPNYYELDDFQVRTPTDIIGQHIHLVKFDVTSSDGSANGFNYEDGSLSPQEVQELIHNINDGGGLFKSFAFDPAQVLPPLAAKAIPYFGPGTNNNWLGAQATIQRWYADPILDNGGFDRTLRTVFTHDHFGPSTHQQAGLYAGLLVEPEGSKWQDSTTGVFLGTNLNRPVGANGQPPDDGGPTTWQANINTVNAKDSYREFAIEFQDRQLVYKGISRTTPSEYQRYAGALPCTAPATPWGWADPNNAINQPTNTPGDCFFAPFPSIVTLSFGTGTYSLNYRNETPSIRVNRNPNVNPGNTPTFVQSDLSNVFRSIERFDPSLNVQPTGPVGNCTTPPCFNFPPVQTGAGPFDPYTPLLRAYEGDQVQIRTLVGAHMSPHSFTVHGVNWLFEPTQFDAADNVSGYRGTQGMGISEHYEMLFTLPRTKTQTPTVGADYFYASSSDKTGLSFGNWGIMRAYRNLQPASAALVPLPNNQPPAEGAPVPDPPPICPANAKVRNISIAAVFARDVLNGPVVYNSRGQAGAGGGQQIVNWNALAYFPEDWLERGPGPDGVANTCDDTVKLLPGKPVEPLILRAAAGDCLNITLQNDLPYKPLNAGSASAFGIQVYTSPEVGLHPQLVALDITGNNGVNVGINPVQTVPPCTSTKNKRTYQWYAGRIETKNGVTTHIPVEFGSIPLTPSDPLMQHPLGMIGGLVIEPEGTDWRNDDNTRASAVVCKPDCTSGQVLFREFVMMLQDDIQPWMRVTPTGAAGAGPINFTGTKPPPSDEVSFLTMALNYRTEPMGYRYKSEDFLENLNIKSPIGIGRALSNTLVLADPQTPVFSASKNQPVRFRMIHPAGTSEQVFTLHGHVWQEEPYTDGSRKIGNNSMSQNQGSRDTFGPNISFDVVIDKAGGEAGVMGDYLYRTFIGSIFQAGLWGVFRVGETGSDICTITRFSKPINGQVLIAGVNTVNPNNGHMAKQVTIVNTTGGVTVELDKVDVNPMTGVWPSDGKPYVAPSSVKSILVRSDEKGIATAPNYITETGQPSAAQAKKLPNQRPNELELFIPIPRRQETQLQLQSNGESGVRVTTTAPDGSQTVIPNDGTLEVENAETIFFIVVNGKQKLTFPDGAMAKRFFNFEIGGSPFSMRPEVGSKAIGTDEFGPGAVLGVLTVKKDVPVGTKLKFIVTSQGESMNGTFVVVP